MFMRCMFLCIWSNSNMCVTQCVFLFFFQIPATALVALLTDMLCKLLCIESLEDGRELKSIEPLPRSVSKSEPRSSPWSPLKCWLTFFIRRPRRGTASGWRDRKSSIKDLTSLMGPWRPTWTLLLLFWDSCRNRCCRYSCCRIVAEDTLGIAVI